MIYRIVSDGIDIYGDTLETTILEPSLDTELNSAGSASFKLPPGHSMYDAVSLLVSDIEIYEDNDLIWFGRPIEIVRNWNNEKEVTCEGALAFFNDTIQRPQTWDSVLVSDFFKHVISQHNAQVPTARQFTVGNITITDKYVYRSLEYDTTFDVLQSMCLDAEGGYLFVRRETDEESGTTTNYIDWLSEVPYVATQPVQFAVNLLDLSQTLNGEDICTAVIPLGANLGREATVNESTAYMSIYESQDTSSTVVGRVEQGKTVVFDYILGTEEWVKISDPYVGYSLMTYLDVNSGDVPLTISHMNGGVDILEDEDGIAVYGRITKIQQWSNIRKASELKTKGQEWLTEEQYDKLTIECDAAELHYLNNSYEAFKVGQMVHVVSTPHLIDKELPMTKISVNLDSGVKKITIGTPPHKTLTEIYKDS